MKCSRLRRFAWAGVFLAAGACMITGQTLKAQTLFSEDFEGLTLQPNVTPEEADDPSAWSPEGPDGWIRNNLDTPSGGVTEFEGWNFLSLVWWNKTSGQGRINFSLGEGIVAVADGDEWDDADPADPGIMNTLLTTPAIDLSGAAAGTVSLVFDSSWLQEDYQTAVVTVSFDEGEAIQLLQWDSAGTGGPNFKDHAINETVVLPINNPEGAGSAKITFAYLDAGNDWWWAIDNVRVGKYPLWLVESDSQTVLDEGDPGKASDEISISMLYNPGQEVTVTLDAGMESMEDFTMSGDGVDGGNGTRVLNFDETNWMQPQAVSLEVIDDMVGEDDKDIQVSLTVASGNPDFDNYSLDPVTVKVLDNDLPGTAVWLENFNSLPLGPVVDETSDDLTAWTPDGPNRWKIINDICTIGDPTQGVTEWEGWSFCDPAFWNAVAGDQNRSMYTKASGAIAVADPDEWDDKGNPDGLCTYWSFLYSAPIPLTNLDPNYVTLTFDSSWRPEDSQKCNLIVLYGDADLTINELKTLPPKMAVGQEFAGIKQLMYWESDPVSGLNPFYHPDAENETLTFDIPVPPDARYMTLVFGMLDATNDWWWAIDNLQINSLSSNLVDSMITLEGDIEVTEGGDAVDSFSVVLDAEPTGDVFVTCDPNNMPDDIMLSSTEEGSELNADGSVTLKFTSANWDTPQNVFVEAVDDTKLEPIEEGVIMFSTDSSDDRYAMGYAGKMVDVTVISNEAGILIDETEGSTDITEVEIIPDLYSIALGTKPSKDVTINLVPATANDLVIRVDGEETSSITFTPANGDWDQYRTVEVVAIDDDELETDPHTVIITHQIDTTDPVYAAGYPVELEVHISENECGAWGFKATDLNQDCRTDLSDLAMIAEDWAKCTKPHVVDCFRP